MKYAITIVLMLAIAGINAQIAEEVNRDYWKNTTNRDFYDIQQKMEDYYADRDHGKGSGYKQWKRWEITNAGLLDQNGMLVNSTKLAYQEHHRYKQTREREIERTTTTGVWTPIGPYSFTNSGQAAGGGLGRINVIAFHPSDPATFYIGSPAGGLWKTIDNGTNWFPLTDGLPRSGVSGVSVHPNNPDEIYILTGDGDGGDSPGIGVLKTENGGDTWFLTGLNWSDDGSGQRESGHKLLIHPSNPDTLFAGTNRGLYVTFDGGLNWDTAQRGNFTDLEFMPGNANTAYATRSNNLNAIYQTTDGGLNWNPIAVGQIPNAGRVEITTNPSNPQLIYAVVGGVPSSGRFTGVYQSLDAGSTFELKIDTPNILGRSGTGIDAQDQSSYDLAICSDPNDALDVVVGSIYVWGSSDGGDNFSLLNSQSRSNANYLHADVHWLEYNPLDGRLFAACDGGISVSSDQGQTWTDLSEGLGITQITNLDVNELDPDQILCGTWDNGVNMTTVGGSAFGHFATGDGGDWNIHATDTDTMVGGINEKLFITHNGGQTVEELDNIGGADIWNKPMIFHPVNTNTLIVGERPLQRSTDLGENWQDLDFNMNRGLTIAPGNTNIFYGVQVSNGANDMMYRSNNFNDADPDFTPINDNPGWLETQRIGAVAINPANPNHVYIAKEGFTANEKVLFSDNGGATWTNLSSASLPNVPIRCMVYQPNSNGGIYVGTEIGVFYYDNDLGDWIPFRNRMPVVPVRDLEIDMNEGYIYAGTYGRGIWKSPIFDQCPDHIFLNGVSNPGYEVFRAEQTLNVSYEIDQSLGLEKHFRSAGYIRFTDGFQTKNGAEIDAIIEVCPSPGIPNGFRVSGTYEGTMNGTVQTFQTQLDEKASVQNITAYPNPFSDRVHFEVVLVEPNSVDAVLLDLSGKHVALVLSKQFLTAGTHGFSFQAQNLQSGSYVCKMQIGGNVEMLKLIKTE